MKITREIIIRYMFYVAIILTDNLLYNLYVYNDLLSGYLNDVEAVKFRLLLNSLLVGILVLILYKLAEQNNSKKDEVKE